MEIMPVLNSQPSSSKTQVRKAGFTLLEVAVVLAIIGLIVGGVIVGRDLIEAANLRATVSQLEKYNAAVNTFKLKYNSLPGDMRPVQAGQFGFFQLTGNCGSTCPYENGLISGGGNPVVVYEWFVFWRHLWQAGLIDEAINNPLLQSSTGECGGCSQFAGLMPGVKYAPKRYWGVGDGIKWTTDGTGFFLGKNTLSIGFVSPIQAFALDTKIDDGKPNTGNMWETYATDNGLWAATAQDGNCTFGGLSGFSADVQYNTNPATGGNRSSDGSEDMCNIQTLVAF